MIPENFILFRFAGYGPELSHGLAARTADGRLVLAEAPSNPGTSLTNAIEVAVDTARQLLGLSEASEVLQWTPDDPMAPNSVWRVTLGDEGPTWTQVRSQDDKQLQGAVAALAKATGAN